MKEFFKNIKKIYKPIELAIIVPTLFLLNYYYFYVTSNNIIWSIIIGLVGLTFFMYHYSYKTRKLENYQQQLNDLLKYVTNMKFFLEIGENALHALTHTASTVTNKEVRKDIEKTIEILEKDASLHTEHFEKYNFPAIDQFHQNLAICYTYGGNVKEIFDPIQKNMMLELEKRDELYKKRKNFAISFNFLVFLIMLIPVLIRFMVSDLWEIFLSYSFMSIATLLFNYFGILFFLYQIQKHKLDISVKV